MDLHDLNINYLAVIVAAIVNIVLGILWYSPIAFGEMWAKEHHISLSSMKKPTPEQHLKSVIISLIMAFVFAILLSWLNIHTPVEGMKLGFLLWLGFVATCLYSGVIWTKVSHTSFYITAGYRLVGLLLMGAILGAWH